MLQKRKSTEMLCNNKEKQKNGGSPLSPPLLVSTEVTGRASLKYHSQRNGCQIHLTDKSPFLITGQAFVSLTTKFAVNLQFTFTLGHEGKVHSREEQCSFFWGGGGNLCFIIISLSGSRLIKLGSQTVL